MVSWSAPRELPTIGWPSPRAWIGRPLRGLPGVCALVSCLVGVVCADVAIARTKAPDSSASIIVGDSARLRSALRNASGGETILLRPGNYSGVIRNLAPISSVLIASLDPERPANITTLQLRSVSNLTFQNLSFEFKGQPAAVQYDLRLADTDNIRFTKSTFRGIARSYAARNADRGQYLALVRESRNFVFDGNDVSGYLHGLAVLNSSRISIRDNHFHHLQGDGLRFAQVQHVTIESNLIREFYGADYSVTHGDYIQFWTTNTTAPSTDITIRGNAFLTGEFHNQAIFFRDQRGDAGKGEMRFQNVLIEDNVIYNNQYHGITIPRADGVIIRGNTLIIHPKPGKTTSAITVSKSTAVQIYDNVSPRITVAPDNEIVRFDGNIDYRKKIRFVERQFVNPMRGAGASLADLAIDPSGSLMKDDGSVYGSELLNRKGSALRLRHGALSGP
jgi:parallel beta-helix repeat protein